MATNEAPTGLVSTSVREALLCEQCWERCLIVRQRVKMTTWMSDRVVIVSILRKARSQDGLSVESNRYWVSVNDLFMTDKKYSLTIGPNIERGKRATKVSRLQKCSRYME